MARPRTKAKKVAPHAEIPDEFLAMHREDEDGEVLLPNGFQEAYNYAISMNNPPKAAHLYAESHYLEWDENAAKDEE